MTMIEVGVHHNVPGYFTIDVTLACVDAELKVSLDHNVPWHTIPISVTTLVRKTQMLGFFPGCGCPLDLASYKNDTAFGFQCLF